MISYKVVELSIVTDETIEDALNTWTAQGWIFDSLHFAMGAGSKRPSMAFIFFSCSENNQSQERNTKGERGTL
ncbi:DUF4177 domain-containing protein [candidate division KSB3 bacterium]|jgi:hypothetical protein|uniref:DUF4177 domain-containing protein n=1 Tax=candidate division KSB3 bacterium TaxID=2044937 RepID=A0A9D5Q6E4_9BACT|nr:DUF4177 domain-containing protein [candidate division KSB3 bacterium]MBD3325754.1 DUF4177 domain-containing protein [candidate division KSB3 bacterium]